MPTKTPRLRRSARFAAFDTNRLYRKNPHLVRLERSNTFHVSGTGKVLDLNPAALKLLARFAEPNSVEGIGDARTVRLIKKFYDHDLILPYEIACVITGCGRSGTRYISWLLTRLGMDVRHEKMGRDGISSCFMAVDAPAGRARLTRSMFRPRVVFHQVRHPLGTISSAQVFSRRVWKFFSRFIPCSLKEPLVVRCAKYWLYWNRKAEEIADWRYRIEDIDKVFDELCARLGIRPDRRVLSGLPRDVNTRRQKYRPVTWEDLERRDRRMTRLIKEQAARYGYRV